MPSAALVYAPSPASGNYLPEEARVFFDILTHDDRNSRYIIAHKNGDKWHEGGMRASSLYLVNLSGTTDTYVTRNGFTGKRRRASDCRQVNAMMFDIDCHEGDHAVAVPRLVNRLQERVAEGEIPTPSLFVNSGRGVQLYYVLATSTSYRKAGGAINEDGISFFKDVERGLMNRIGGIVSDLPGTKLDTSVTDFSRVGRVPGSYNSAAKRRCKLVSYSYNYFDLAGLKEYCAPLPRARKPHKAQVIKFSRLLISRLRKVEALQAHRKFDCVGSRENMCFVHYNTATQIFGPEEAFRLTCAFNNNFTSPLPQSDIESIKRTVDSVVIEYGEHKGEKGFYPLSAESVVDKLHLTPDEIAAVGFFASRRADQREAAKAATRKKRADRDKRICTLYGEGFTQAEVAEKVGCSRRTVMSVTSREGVSRGQFKQKRRKDFEQVLAAKNECEKNCRTSCCDVLREGRGDLQCVCVGSCGVDLLDFGANEKENSGGSGYSPPLPLFAV